jgi:glycosyltransferase involved in cell wall biosynthesis
MSESSGARLGERPSPRAVPGVRVVLDVRPLQAPDRAPVAAAYLDGLLGAFDAAPLAGESFTFLIGSDLDDPTARFARLEVVGRRQLPPTRLLRSAAMTVDPFLIRGAAVGSAWRAERAGAAGAVYHAIGSGPLPIVSKLPVVATLLDLAPWEMPDAFQGSIAGRFGQRLRAQLLRDAAAVIVGSDATARAVRRLLHVRRDRLHVVRLAPRPGFGPGPAGSTESAEAVLRERLGVSGRYVVFTGRFDTRLDLDTLLEALASLAAAGRAAGVDPTIGWPPRLLLVGASPADRASIARVAARRGIGESIAYAPALPVAELAGLVRGARAAILPVISEAAGLPVIEAIASGTPVIASAVGPLPELIGPAGLLVEPGDPGRLAVALATMWADDGVYGRVAAAARERAETDTRTWADVARETRTIYADVGSRGLR